MRHTGGRGFGRPTNGAESKYLLTGFGACAVCGCTIIVRTRSHGGHRGLFYGCSGYHLRGTAVCRNKADIPLTLADDAVLTELAEDLLNPKVISAAIRKAVDRVVARAKEPDQGTLLTRELQTVERDLERLVAAVKAGGNLTVLVDALKAA